MVSKITTAYALLCLSLASLCILKEVKAIPYRSTNCNTLMAVFTYQGTRCYIYGSGSTTTATIDQFSSNKKYTIPAPFFLERSTAAVGYVDENSDELYFTYGKDFEKGQPTEVANYVRPPLKHSGAEKELLKTRGFVEIDAAFAGEKSIITYFEGCDYIAVDAKSLTVEAKGKNSDVNLPCDVDAAWRSRDYKHAFIVKGENLWVWPLDRKTAHRDDLYKKFPEMTRFNLCSR